MTYFPNIPATDPINVAWMIERTARAIYYAELTMDQIAKSEGYTEARLMRLLSKRGMVIAADGNDEPILIHAATREPVAFAEKKSNDRLY